MFSSKKSGARRAEIRRNRPDKGGLLKEFQADGPRISLAIAIGFCILAALILSQREQVVPYRPGQYASSDIFARVNFTYHDEYQVTNAREQARRAAPRVYATAEEPWKKLEEQLLALPDRLAKVKDVSELPPPYKDVIDAGALTFLQDSSTGVNRAGYNESVRKYVAGLRSLKLAIVPADERADDLERSIIINGEQTRGDATYSPAMTEELAPKFATLAQEFVPVLAPKIVNLTLAAVAPTHRLDEQATAQAQNVAADRVPHSAGDIAYEAGQKIVPRGEIDTRRWELLRAENDAFIGRDDNSWRAGLGLVISVVLLTAILAIYAAKYQPRIVQNHARAVAIAALLLSTLLLAQLAAIGSSPLYVFGLAPTIIVAMIMTIAYDQRFAAGVSSIHAVLVTLAFNESISFFLILWTGVMTCCFLLDEIRTRSKLIEVGGATSLTMICATAAAGALALDPPMFILRNALFAGAAGLGVGFIVLGILPFIEKTFRITTSMTLLELADASQPLLRRLSLEAPGTYSHSLQVATLAEEAAEAIGANSLLCRVASYYHDIGKINKAEYFIENQSGGFNRHINLSPSVSLLIIIGHVKDGIELAREYNLPTSLFPFIQQHHGTTLVEFFYDQACRQQETRQPDQPAISETQYRYPGPKPKSKEIAVVMLADAVESATRAMNEPSAGRIEALVHDLAMKRLLDGQFDECDLTMRDLERIERALVKTLLGIYHGRIAYPSNREAQPAMAPTTVVAKTA